MPSFLALAAWIEFRDSLDNEVAFEKLLNGIRQIAPGAHPVEPPSTQCPYPGLRYFDIDDAPYFFGREALTDWLVSDVRRMIGPSGEPRFLALVGTSGSGKSSLARAGLLRALGARQRQVLALFLGEAALLAALGGGSGLLLGMGIAQGLDARLTRDFERGHTSVGPHVDDLELRHRLLEVRGLVEQGLRQAEDIAGGLAHARLVTLPDLLREAVGDEPAQWFPALTGRRWPGSPSAEGDLADDENWEAAQ